MEREFDFIYWNDLKSKLRQKYPQLTNADLLWRHGSEDDLIRMTASRLKKTKKELQEIIDSL